MRKKTQNNDIMSFAPPGVWISFSFTLCARMLRSCAGICTRRWAALFTLVFLHSEWYLCLHCMPPSYAIIFFYMFCWVHIHLGELGNPSHFKTEIVPIISNLDWSIWMLFVKNNVRTKNKEQMLFVTFQLTLVQEWEF